MTDAQKFVLMLERTYGKYPGPMMKEVIAERLERASPDHLTRLYNEIVTYYMPNYVQPPTLAHILKYQREMAPAGRVQIEDQTEGYVSREEGLVFIKEIMRKLCEKEK